MGIKDKVKGEKEGKSKRRQKVHSAHKRLRCRFLIGV
mgnify:CR=1 FL=1